MNPEERRKYKRIKTPPGTFAGWKGAGQTAVARVGNLGLGGAFFVAEHPPAVGSIIEILLSLPFGEVRARSIVRRSMPGKGMGLQFVQMRPEDRAKLNQFLSRAEEKSISEGRTAGAQSQANRQTPKPPAAPAELALEQELAQLMEVAQKGNYYQLLGVAHVAPDAEVKRKYYAVAKKFHPDLHMDKKHLGILLKLLMERATEAYQTLRDDRKRAEYDRKLSASGAFNLLDRNRTESQETVEDCERRAVECIRAGNFVGSITWLRKCVSLMPESGKYHALLARSLATVTAYRHEATIHFERAIELDPYNTDAYFRFGELYEALKLPWRAAPLYAKILEINPDHAKAREKLASAATNAKASQFQSIPRGAVSTRVEA